MDLYPLLLDILKYTLSGLGIVWVAFYLIKPYLDRSERISLLEYKKGVSSHTFPLRLQAHERLVLFIERVNPANMLLRVSAASYSASELHALLVGDIRSEFQHNVTQQLYVSERAWNIVQRVKDDTITIINNEFKSLSADATGLDLSKAILNRLGQADGNLYDVSLALIKKDIQELF